MEMNRHGVRDFMTYCVLKYATDYFLIDRMKGTQNIVLGSHPLIRQIGYIFKHYLD